MEKDYPTDSTILDLFKTGNSKSYYDKICDIFTMIDIKIAGGICSKWKDHVDSVKSCLHFILILGRTTIGKSSYINFLAQKRIAVIGTDRESTTFFPSKHTI